MQSENLNGTQTEFTYSAAGDKNFSYQEYNIPNPVAPKSDFVQEAWFHLCEICEKLAG